VITSLDDALNSLRNITVELIGFIEKEQYDNLDELLNNRQSLIDSMKALKYEANEFNELCSKYEIPGLEKKLTGVLTDKQSELKLKMSNITQGKSAVKNYNKKQYVDSVFFTKKI
jgi:hypothetical protein